MYVPPKFAMDEDAAWAIVHEAGAGMLVVAKPEGLFSVMVPVVVSDDRATIRSHLAKANPWWRGVEPGTEVLGLFLVASAYVSPLNYPSRLEDPGVVPTWNYVAAEVRGRMTTHDDPEWLRRQVGLVTDTFEAGLDPRWHVEDAGEEYVQRQLRAIVGLQIDVVSIEGKAKLSQNRPEDDHDSVRDHLAQGSPAERNVARRMRSDG